MNPRELLLSIDFLRVLPDEVIARLEAACVRRTFRDGQLVLQRGAAPDALYGIVTGEARVLARSALGREFVITYLGAGQWFGEIALLDGLARTHDVVAHGEAEILALPRREFLALLDGDPRLYKEFAALLCRKLRLTFALLEDSVLLSLPGRLAKRLLGLADDHGSAAAVGTTIDLHLPQEELARMLGASREAIARHLASWQKQGVLELRYGRITILDAAALQTIAADAELSP